MNPSKNLHRRLRTQTIAVLTAALVANTTTQAFVFDLGEARASFDTTLSVGGLYRLNDPDPRFYGITSTFNGVPGEQRSVNADDGNLNYEKGLASLLLKANHDLQIDYGKMGLFVRGYYFYDFENADEPRARTQLNRQARDIVARGGELLDAYVYFKPDLGNMPARLAIGKQVLSWGESTFIPNGINSVNPIDVAKLRLPGAELKEALRPINMVSFSLGVTDNTTVEGFYLLDWERTRVDPPGTYFSTNDFVAKGGERVYLGFGAVPDNSPLGPIMRGPDNEPQNSGQYGIAVRYLAPGLNNTEFGLYYMNYHSRLPVISARTPTQAIDPILVQNTASALATANLAPAMIDAGIAPATVNAILPNLVGSALLGVPVDSLAPALQPYAAFYPAAQQIAQGAGQVGLLTAAASGRYLIEFPEDIHLWGASFNTNIGGVAFQGEVSYRHNQPLQFDDVELLFAALTSLHPRFNANQIGTFGLNTYVPGWHRHKVWTGQLTATKVTRGYLGADQTTFLAEVGFVRANLPDQSQLRYDGPGTFVGGDLASMTSAGGVPLAEPADAFAQTFSWGYQLVGRLDYNNAFAGVNFSPLITFAHDVHGNTPLPLGNFLEGRKTITIGADFNFQNVWAVELRYVNFTGAGKYNLLADRDYVSATVEYSF